MSHELDILRALSGGMGIANLLRQTAAWLDYRNGEWDTEAPPSADIGEVTTLIPDLLERLGISRYLTALAEQVQGCTTWTGEPVQERTTWTANRLRQTAAWLDYRNGEWDTEAPPSADVGEVTTLILELLERLGISRYLTVLAEAVQGHATG